MTLNRIEEIVANAEKHAYSIPQHVLYNLKEMATEIRRLNELLSPKVERKSKR